MGKDALHGAHHEAQKSTRTTLPDVAGISGVASGATPADDSAGNESPTFTSARDAAASPASTAVRRKAHLNLGDHILEKAPGLGALALGHEQSLRARTRLDEFDALRHTKHECRRRQHSRLQAGG